MGDGLFTSAEFLEDPYPTYARLREETPAFFDEDWNLRFFSRHGDVQRMLRDPRFGRDPRNAVPADRIDQAAFERIYPARYPTWNRYVRESFIDFEPPDHTRIRRLVQHAFTRRAVEAHRPNVEADADRLLDRALEAGTMDAIADYAVPIPLNLIASLIGVPTADRMRLVEWSHAIVRLYDPACSDDHGREAEAAAIEFVDYVDSLIAERKQAPGSDLVSDLISAEIEGQRLTDDEIIATTILVLNAGHEATVHAIGNGLLALAAHPSELRRLRAHPDLIPTAVNELLRFDAPLHMFERWVLEDLDWNGISLRQGSKVGLLLGSANRDSGVFEVADVLDLGRIDNPHVSFGGGIHRCVGAPLARLELEVAFARFAARVSTFEVAAGALPRTGSLIFRGVTQLPVDVFA